MTNTMPARYTITATADCCDYTGTLADIELHDCAITENGGRCEDYPACGHTDGDGCQHLAVHTSAYWLERMDEDDWADDPYGDSDCVDCESGPCVC